MLWSSLLLVAVVFFASFAQGVAGFGIALIAMPVLVPLLGVDQAGPLVALLLPVSGVAMTLYYRERIDLRAVAGLTVSSLVAVPFGVWLAQYFDDRLVTTALGVLISGYGLYGLLAPALPELGSHGWEYLFGLLSGVLSGAYNVGGPPLVIYATCRRWEPGAFKGNLQGIGLIKSMVVVLSHGLAGNISQGVWSGWLLAMPALLIGTGAGLLVDRLIDQLVFKRIVLIMLIVLGMRLVLPV